MVIGHDRALRKVIRAWRRMKEWISLMDLLSLRRTGEEITQAIGRLESIHGKGKKLGMTRPDQG
jgi:hypothetical protein